MIRILHVVHGMDCGGTETIIMNIYRNIDRTRVQFDFLVHTEKRCFFDDEIELLGGKIYRVPYYRMINCLAYKRALIKLFTSHSEWGVVHGHLGSCANIYLRVAKHFGLFTIAHSHNVNSSHLSFRELLYRLHAINTRGVADFYMACSYEAGKDRYGKTIADSPFFKVLKNGINSADYSFNKDTRSEIRTEFDLDNKIVIGNVGRFSYQKNHLFMLKVLWELLQKSDNYVLMLVGDGELKDEIVSAARKLKVLDNIIFTGVRKDISRLLQAFDVFLFPSYYEGLGIALIEAQAACLPCAANKDGIMPIAIISDLVKLKSLNEGAEKWADLIQELTQQKLCRTDMSLVVKAAGFDIIEVSRWLESFYLSIKIATK